MKSRLLPRIYDFEFPSEGEPDWSTKVDRWYQLDAPSFGLADAFWKWAPKEKPDLILFASPRASNESDFIFSHTGRDSAHRFAHTLPNVRSAPVCQLLHWAGPTLCVQADPHTWMTALAEATALSPHFSEIWVVGVFGREPIGAVSVKQPYSALFWSLHREDLAAAHAELEDLKSLTDAAFLKWARESL